MSSLIVQMIDVVVHKATGECLNERSLAPSWAEIAAAIRRLDRAEYPSVYLHVEPLPEEWDEPEHTLDVFGGSGEYALEIWLPGSIVRYVDPPRGDATVNLARRDAQGGFMPARRRCSDIELVLKVAQHFAMTGQPLDGVSWERDARA